MRLILDDGALIALERNDRAMRGRLKLALAAEQGPVCHGGIVGQAWRGRGPRQALLAKVLEYLEVRPLDSKLGRAAGDGEFTDWDAVCDAVRRVARFSFETGSVLRHYS